MHNGKIQLSISRRRRRCIAPTPPPMPSNTYINQSRQTLIGAHDGKEKRNREMSVAFAQHQRTRKTLFNDFFLAIVSLAFLRTKPKRRRVGVAWCLCECVFAFKPPSVGITSVLLFFVSLLNYVCFFVSC